MKRLVYSRRGWFAVLEWMAGVRDIRFGVTLPDSRGRIGKQRILIGPFSSAAQASRL